MPSVTLAEQLKNHRTTQYIESALEKEIWRHRFSPDRDTLILPSVEETRSMAMAFISGDFIPICPERLQVSKLGSDKKRVLYIYPIHTRMMLKAVHFCVSHNETCLSSNCLAFRPGFSIHRAFRKITASFLQTDACIRIDIKNYFNSIPAHKMISILEKIHPDETGFVFSLKHMLLDQKVIENQNIRNDNQKGVMAGMPLSPYLANHYLNDFDRLATQHARLYARYSDDMLFFCPPEDTEKLFQWIKNALESLGLEINTRKSEIIMPGNQWSFLGLSYHNGDIGLSEGTVKKMKGKISRAARKLYRWKIKNSATTERAARAMIRKFQYKFYGTTKSEQFDDEKTWSRWYFPLLTDANDLKVIDAHMQRWLRYLATGQHTKKNFQSLPYSKLRQLGYIPLTAAYYKKDLGFVTR